MCLPLIYASASTGVPRIWLEELFFSPLVVSDVVNGVDSSYKLACFDMSLL